MVVPCLASMGTQNAVPNFALFCSSWTMSGMRSSSSRSPVMGRQIEAAAVAGHEVDDLGRDLLGGDGEVALVLAVLVVDDHDHAALRGCPRWPRGWC